MEYQTENKLPIVWGAAGLLAYLSLGPIAAVGVALMWQSRVQRQVCIDRGWMPNDYMPELPTVDVPALPMGEPLDDTQTVPGHTPLGSAPGHQPPAPTSITVPVSVHNHLGRERSAAPNPTSAIPAPGRVQTEAPDLSLYPDLDDRAHALMTAMGKAGMPIGSILKHPFIMAIGGSQSGKTSLSTVLSVLRMATGCRVDYGTVDDDVPPVKWSKLADRPMAYLDMMNDVADTISAAGKGALIGQSWVFDEVLRSSQEFGADITKLLIPSLTKGAKTGGLLIVLTHAKTVSAHNLKPGFSEAWERDRVAIEALRERDQFGGYSPKGEYLVSIPGETPEVWRWPEWMVTNLDPVGWVLDAFPEFKGKAIEGADRGQDRPLAPSTPAPKWASAGYRVQGAGLGKEDIKTAETLDPVYPAPDTLHPAPCTLQSYPVDDKPADPIVDSLLRWIEKKGDDGVLVGQIHGAGLAPLKGLSCTEIREYLDLMVAEQSIELIGKRYRVL